MTDNQGPFYLGWNVWPKLLVIDTPRLLFDNKYGRFPLGSYSSCMMTSATYGPKLLDWWGDENEYGDVHHIVKPETMRFAKQGYGYCSFNHLVPITWTIYC